MSVFICFAIGVLITISAYLLMSRNLLQWLLGIVILSSSVNLVILIAGRLTTIIPPFVPLHQLKPLSDVANPLPQALILTAIVIGFGLLVFALVLIRQIWQRAGQIDSNKLTLAEPIYYMIKKTYE